MPSIEKHLFQINNPVSLRCALSVIKTRQLQNENCIFLVTKAFKSLHCVPVDIECYQIDTMTGINYENSFILFHFFPFLKDWLTLTKNIKKITKNSTFYFYSAHLLFSKSKVIAFHRKCIGIYILEEGTFSYLTDMQLNKYCRTPHPNRIIDAINTSFYSRLIGPIWTIYPVARANFLGFYCFNQCTFPSFPNKTILDFSFPSNQHQINYQHVLLLDNFFDNISFKSFIYIAVIIKALSDISKHASVIATKLHPRADSLDVRRVLDVIANDLGIELVFLDNSVNIEEALTPSATIYGVCSSALFYCASMGIKSVSYSNYLASVDSTAITANNFILTIANIPESQRPKTLIFK